MSPEPNALGRSIRAYHTLDEEAIRDLYKHFGVSCEQFYHNEPKVSTWKFFAWLNANGHVPEFITLMNTKTKTP